VHYTLCDSILDLFQNSVEAGSTKISMDFIQKIGSLKVKIKDNGKGMDRSTLAKVKDPFYTDGVKHKSRKVGLGIPFLLQTTEMTDGYFNIKSVLGRGTELDISFNLDHWDTPPIGSVTELLLSAMAFEGDYDLIVHREDIARKLTYRIARSELIDVLGDLTQATNMILLKEFIESQELDN